MSSASASVTVTSNAVIVSPCAYSLFPGSVITGAAFVASAPGAPGAPAAAVTVIVKVAVDSRVPSDAVIVTVYALASAATFTVPDTMPEFETRPVAKPSPDGKPVAVRLAMPSGSLARMTNGVIRSPCA